VQVATGAGVLAAQKALDRLGYYPGPQDGRLTAGVKTALQNYQRDQGLPATGSLDATTAQRLAPFARQ
jgi:localization factor PodJL